MDIINSELLATLISEYVPAVVKLAERIIESYALQKPIQESDVEEVCDLILDATDSMVSKISQYIDDDAEVLTAIIADGIASDTRALLQHVWEELAEGAHHATSDTSGPVSMRA